MKRLLLLLITIASINITYAQDQPKTFSATDIKKMADDKKFQFNAKIALLTPDPTNSSPAISSEPTQNNRIELNTAYSASLTPDSLVSYLPYFKSKTEVSGNDSKTSLEEDPNKSSTTGYDYEAKQKKNGTVTITIRPKAGSKITKYIFELAPNGTAKLEITIEDYKIVKYEGSYTNS